MPPSKNKASGTCTSQLPARRTRHSRYFPGQFPPEVLLLIFENFVVREPDFTPRGEGDPSDALRALCLTSRAFNALATGLLYRHVRCWKRTAAEQFLRTAESDRWTTGEMRGKMKQWVKSVHWRNFERGGGEWRADTGTVERLVRVVDPGAVEVLGFHLMWFKFSALAPFTNLRRLNLESCFLALDDAPSSTSLPSLTRLRLCNPSCTSFPAPFQDLRDDPAASNWDALLSPAVLPALSSLTLDIEGDYDDFLGADGGSAALHALLGQLTELRTCAEDVRIDTQSAETWKALTRLETLAMWAEPGEPWDGEGLRCALEHLPVALERLDLTEAQADDVDALAEVLVDAFGRRRKAVEELEVVLLPGPGAWGLYEEEERAEGVGRMAAAVRAAIAASGLPARVEMVTSDCTLG